MGIAKQVVVTGALVGCAAIGIAKLPPWLVERGAKSVNACLAAAFENHGDPSDCRTGAGFAIGAAFPHVRAHARQLREDLDRRRAQLVVEHALDTGVGAHEAIAVLLAGVADPDARLDWLVSTLAEHGAIDELARLDLGKALVSEPELPMRAALALGDLALARQRVPAAMRVTWQSGARLGAAACLLGAKDRGLALLASADRAWTADARSPDAGTRLAALHCGGTAATLGFEPGNVPDADRTHAMLVRAYDPAFQAGRRSAIGIQLAHDASIFANDYVGAVALAAAGTTDLAVDDMLELAQILADRTHGYAALTPAEVFAPADASRESMAYVPPGWLAAAAAHFEHAAAIAPRELSDDDHVDVSEEARAHPRDLLRTTAARLYRDAALYQLRRGDRRGLAELLSHARALDPPDLGRVPVELAAGDAGALTTLGAWAAAHPQPDPADAEAVAVLRALARIAAGDLRGAREDVQHANTVEAEWLQLALALALDQPTPPLRNAKPDEMSPEVWAHAIAAQRLPSHVYVPPEARRVLPAVLFVVARAAKASGRDPERTIDAYFDDDVGRRSLALARAEAARWRNDEPAAARWQARAATIESLFVDDHAAVLGGIAGLW